MKMTAEDYGKLKVSIIKGLMDKNANLRTLTAEYKRDGLSDKRLRWDLIRLNKDTVPIVCGMYHYLNDDHVDTALRHIVIDLMHF